DPIKHIVTSKDDPNLPLQRSGHGDWVETQNGEVYIVHLSGRPLSLHGSPGKRFCPLGRETAIQKAHWTQDGWLRLTNGSNKPDMEVPAPDLPLHPWPEAPARATFDCATLPIDSQWLRSPLDEKMLSLKDRPAHLRLYGHESIGSWDKQALAARRQQAFCFTATTKVEFTPTNIQQQAGLICYYNAHKHHYLHIGRHEQGERFLSVV